MDNNFEQDFIQMKQEDEKSLEKEKRNNGIRRLAALLVLMLLLMSVSVGFAVLSSTLKINGTSKVHNNTWDIDVNSADIVCPIGQICTINPANPEILVPDNNNNGAIIWLDGNTVYFKHLLSLPGDLFTFSVKFSNNGTIDAKVSDVTTSVLNATAQKYLTYSVTYADGSTVKKGDKLKAGTSATFKVTVAYKSEVTSLPTMAEYDLINEVADGHTGATTLFTVNYEQA